MPGRRVADNVADHLRSYLLDRGLTQEQFALEVGRTQSVISNWVNAKYTWPADELGRIARVLNVPVADLYAGVEPTTPTPAERADGSAA